MVVPLARVQLNKQKIDPSDSTKLDGTNVRISWAKQHLDSRIVVTVGPGKWIRSSSRVRAHTPQLPGRDGNNGRRVNAEIASCL